MNNILSPTDFTFAELMHTILDIIYIIILIIFLLHIYYI